MARRVVVLDGQGVLLKLIDRLRQENYDVIVCAFDPQAFKCIRDAQPDVVVMDLSRPGGPGLDLLSVIKTDPTLSVVPMVLFPPPSPDVEHLVQEFAAMRLYVVPPPPSVGVFLAEVEKALQES